MGGSLELRDYLRIIRRRRWVIALSFAACATLALLYSSSRPPVYEASAKVFIGPRSVDRTSITSALEELTASREFIASYAELLRSRTLAERVVERLQLDISPAVLVRRIQTNLIQATRIIQVRVSDGAPERAALIANTAVDAFVKDVQLEFGGRTGVQATVFEPAIPPVSRTSPAPMRDGVLGALLGLMIGMSGAVLLEQLDTRLRHREDVERILAPLPLLASVPNFPGGTRAVQIPVAHDPKSAAAEAFRILRTNVQFLAVDRPVHRVMVTSAAASDGKSTVATNLAASLASAGFTTMLIESDLRRPSLHEQLRLSSSPGISDVLIGRKDLSEAVRETSIPGLLALTSGAIPPNPAELLGSQRMADLLDQAAAMADVIVLDTPPTLPVTDAVVLAPNTDGVIVVVRAGKTHREGAKAAVEQFERVGVRVLGIVLNDAKQDEGDHYYRYYGGYKSRDPDPEPFTQRRSGEWAASQQDPLASGNGGQAGSASRRELELNPLRNQPPE